MSMEPESCGVIESLDLFPERDVETHWRWMEAYECAMAELPPMPAMARMAAASVLADASLAESKGVR